MRLDQVLLVWACTPLEILSYYGPGLPHTVTIILKMPAGSNQSNGVPLMLLSVCHLLSCAPQAKPILLHHTYCVILTGHYVGQFFVALFSYPLLDVSWVLSSHAETLSIMRIAFSLDFGTSTLQQPKSEEIKLPRPSAGHCVGLAETLVVSHCHVTSSTVRVRNNTPTAELNHHTHLMCPQCRSLCWVCCLAEVGPPSCHLSGAWTLSVWRKGTAQAACTSLSFHGCTSLSWQGSGSGNCIPSYRCSCTACSGSLLGKWLQHQALLQALAWILRALG